MKTFLPFFNYSFSVIKKNYVLPFLLLFFASTFGQNAIVGAGFSTGWGIDNCTTSGGTDFKYLGLTTGASGTGTYGVTTVANGTGNQYFRFGKDWSSTYGQYAITPGSDTNITPNTTYSLNMTCTNSGSQYITVGSTSYNYVFKTINAGTAPTGTFTFFEVQGAVRSVTAVAQSPLSTSVTPSSTTTVTATLDGALSTGQAVYLRYTTNSYSTSTVVQMTGSGTSYTAAIPSGTNTAGAAVSYYIFTSGTANVASNGSNADLYTINLNNNAGSNYTYTVTTPAAIYVHNFGTTTITTHPYTVAPATFATNLSSSSWANSLSAWTSFAGSAGQAIVIQPGTGVTSTETLTFTVASGYSVSISSFNYWRQRTATGPLINSITINGITASTGVDTPPTTGAAKGVTNVANPVVGLTGTITVVITLSAPSGASQNLRLDDFTLNGNVVVTPIVAPVVTAGSPAGTVAAAFSYNIVASNSPTSYAVSSGTLPAGLSLNTTTGAITGTPTAAGSSSVNVTATNTGGTSPAATLSFTIAKGSQTITFAALTGQTYGVAPYSLTGTSTSGLTVAFASSNTAVATVSGTTITIVGAGSTNITASQAGDTNYNAATNVVRALVITAKGLTMTGVTANNKVQDGGTVASLSGTPSLVGVVAGDVGNVTVSGTPTATFASAGVGTGIVVTVTGYTLAGSAAGNYTVAQPTGLTANITALGAPTATAATSILQTAFNANWGAETNANNGYELDVSTSSTFGVLTPTSVTESFETGLTASYVTGNVTMGTGIWAITTVLKGTTGVNSGTASAQLQSATGAALISPSYNSISSLSFYVTSSTASGAIQVNYSIDGGTTWNPAPGSPFTGLTTTKVLKSITLNSTSNDVKIQILRTAATIYIDDVTINYSASTPSFVSGYNAKAISGQATVTSLVNTNLTESTIYYYRVRAVNGSVVSPSSNTISLTTKPTSVSWSGSAWSNTTGPDKDIEAVILGAFNTTAHGAFAAKKLTLTTGSLTVNSGTNITVENELINSLTAADFVVENNANLVQNNTATNTGSITVKRNSAAILRQDYTLWSSPVTNSGLFLQAFSPLTLSTRFYTYDPSSNIYVAVSSPSTTPFAPATSYLIRVANNHNAVTPTAWAGQFTGVPNNGPVSLSVTSGTYNATGNPYPSTISADSFISANSITEALYFWRKTNNTAQATTPTTSYATYTTAGGAGTGPSGLGGITPNGTIQVGQGFIAKATSSALNFTNTMRTTNNSDQFLRTGERSRVWLDLFNTNGSVSQVLVAYMTGATLGVDDAIDGHYINDAPTALTSIINNEEFAVQGRPLPFEATDVVPLGFKSQVAGSFTIALNNVDGLFASNGQPVYLKDNLTNAIQDLTAGSYNFATEAGTFNSRFEIVYENLLATQNPTFTENSVVVYKNDQQVVVNTGKTTIAKVQVYDISGRLLVTKADVNATEVRFTAGMANQVLLVKVTSTSGAVVTKKIVN